VDAAYIFLYTVGLHNCNVQHFIYKVPTARWTVQRRYERARQWEKNLVTWRAKFWVTS